jgi:hypothetical protein
MICLQTIPKSWGKTTLKKVVILASTDTEGDLYAVSAIENGRGRKRTREEGKIQSKINPLQSNLRMTMQALHPTEARTRSQTPSGILLEHLMDGIIPFL